MRLLLHLAFSSLLALLLMLLTGCSGGNSAKGPHVEFTTIFSGSTVSVYTGNLFSWSPDGTTLAFGAGSSDVYTVSAAANSTPTAIANIHTMSGASGAYDPMFLSDGSLAYFTGWLNFGNPSVDYNMHIMKLAAGYGSSSILHSFNGSSVGLSTNQVNSPEQISISSNGSRAVGIWSTGIYTMDFNTSTYTKIADHTPGASLAIAPNGQSVAYSASGTLVIHPFGGGSDTTVGSGYVPSWNSDSSILGYVSGNNYVLYTVATQTSVSYALPTSVTWQQPVLSPNATKIAARTYDSGIGTGILLGTLSAE